MVLAGTLVTWASWPMVSSRSIAVPPSRVCGGKDTPSTDWKVKRKALSSRRPASLRTGIKGNFWRGLFAEPFAHAPHDHSEIEGAQHSGPLHHTDDTLFPLA